MEDNKKQELVAAFDFCGTIANFQTFDPFLCYLLSKTNKIGFLDRSCFRRFINIINKICSIFVPDCALYKRILIQKTKGEREEVFYRLGEEYYKMMIKPNLIGKTMSLIEDLKRGNYTLLIASAGSKYYIHYFAEEFGVDNIITAEIEIKNGCSTGRLVDDCMGVRKAEALMKKYQACELPFSVVVSDSVSDLPFFALGKRKIVISKGHHQEWIKDGMEEIIWE